MESVLIIPSIATLAGYLILFLQYPCLDQGLDSGVHHQGNTGLADSGFPCAESENKNITFCNLGFILFSPNQRHILKKTLFFTSINAKTMACLNDTKWRTLSLLWASFDVV